MTVCLGVERALPWREARRLDLNAQELGVPVATLVQRAGKALAAEVAKAARGRDALFFCGKGNNGGDGLAAVAHLQSKGQPASAVLVEPPQGPGRVFLERIDPGTVTPWTGKAERAWVEAPVLVDCLLGSGLTGPPRAPYGSAIRYLNRRHAAGATVIACDLPSGLGSPLAVRPDATVTFHAAKEGMTREACGRIVVAPIGIPRAAETEIGLGDLAAYYPVPRPDSHKGDNGTLLVVAGGPYTGAPYYAGMAAYRTGADLVHACLPHDAARVVATYGPEIMVHSVGPGDHLTLDGAKKAAEWMARATAMVIGPGLGTKAGTRKAVARLLEDAAARGLPVVVDADGLDALTPDLLARHGRRMVLTPHSREFQDLAGVSANERNVRAYARKHSVTVAWKHQGALVTDGNRSRLCRRGHPTMTVGGTGDVLAGCIGALLAKGAPPFEAACAGTYLVGSAGEVAASLRSWGATATDVAEAIPAVLLRIA
ncbi:MAG: ADP-dependent NAD(P)H-hydrate dehydratase / NAD(P)H-hydrate epimerase [Thermoplasmata archaeon]|nr:ADP-dependent NAD(P)H-hydrate dehydratase / NAD(P)H-hydrate epimerase [Thermoplasmata archaeon]